MFVLLFQIGGVALLCYVVRSYMLGEVYARFGIGGRRFRRDEEPFRYWFILASYTLLAIAMFFFFGQRWE
jgi:hypothetical protein